MIYVSIDIEARSCIQECPIRTAARPTLAPERKVLVSLFEPRLVVLFMNPLCLDEVGIWRTWHLGNAKEHSI